MDLLWCEPIALGTGTVGFESAAFGHSASHRGALVGRHEGEHTEAVWSEAVSALRSQDFLCPPPQLVGRSANAQNSR